MTRVDLGRAKPFHIQSNPPLSSRDSLLCQALNGRSPLQCRLLEDSDHTIDTLAELGVPIHIVWYVSDSLTHKKGQSYFDYIRLINVLEDATKVKIADIVANLSDSPTNRQTVKYYKALCILCEEVT